MRHQRVKEGLGIKYQGNRSLAIDGGRMFYFDTATQLPKDDELRDWTDRSQTNSGCAQPPLTD
jgi:hypothetical protein